jgi:hypothetical protein
MNAKNKQLQSALPVVNSALVLSRVEVKCTVLSTSFLPDYWSQAIVGYCLHGRFQVEVLNAFRGNDILAE